MMSAAPLFVFQSKTICQKGSDLQRLLLSTTPSLYIVQVEPSKISTRKFLITQKIEKYYFGQAERNHYLAHRAHPPP